MQFALIATLAAVAATALASPMNLLAVRDCDVAACAIALGPTAVGCGAAVVEAGANPIADAGCLASGLNAAVNVPAKCTGCAQKLGINKVVSGAENAVGSAVSGAESAVGGAVNDVKGAFDSIF